MGDFLLTITDPLTPGAKNFFRNILHPSKWSWNYKEPSASGGAAGATGSGGGGTPGIGVLKMTEVHDPVASLLADKKLERDAQIDAAERGQHSQERQLMTIGQRRISIMQDMMRVRRQIEQEEMRTAPDTLKSEEERADWEAKRAERLAGLRGQLAGLTGETREHPLFSGGGDSLSKVGLFSSASALAFPPGTGIAGDIKQIASNTWKMAHREDPHAP